MSPPRSLTLLITIFVVFTSAISCNIPKYEECGLPQPEAIPGIYNLSVSIGYDSLYLNEDRSYRRPWKDGEGRSGEDIGKWKWHKTQVIKPPKLLITLLDFGFYHAEFKRSVLDSGAMRNLGKRNRLFTLCVRKGSIRIRVDGEGSKYEYVQIKQNEPR